MQKKIYFLGNFFFPLKKRADFLAIFFIFYGKRSVTAAWATPSPWSIDIELTIKLLVFNV